MTISFKTDIVPLFTSMDIEHMSYAGVSLDDHAYMSQPANASGEQPWSQDQVQLFNGWMDGGYQP